MNLVALRTFLTIVETGSLVAASAHLNVTQSTVTARLKVLEDELGQTLINRHKSGATLTPAGTRLRRFAETISDLWSQARQETALPEGVSSICNLASHPDLWPDLGNRLFSDLRQKQPTVGLSVWHGGPVDLTHWIDSGLVDMTLTYWPASKRDQSVHQLKGDVLRMVSTKPKQRAAIDQDYVFVESGDEFGRMHAATFADSDYAKLSFGSAILGLEHLLTYGGYAYLPERIAKPYISKEQLYTVEDAPSFNRNSYLIVTRTIAEQSAWVEELITNFLNDSPS